MSMFAECISLYRFAVRLQSSTWKSREVAPLKRCIGSYLNHDNQENPAIQERVSLLAEKLKCRKVEVRMAIHKYPRLLTVRKSKLLGILKIFRNEGISKDEILTYPDIFTHSMKSLTERINELKNLEEKVKLVSLRESNRLYGQKIQRIQTDRESEIPYETKEELLAARLNCPQVLASELLEKHALTTTKLSTIKSKLDLLVGLPNKLILDKLWVLRFPLDVLDYRFKVLNSGGITHENCDSYIHLLSCEEKNFAPRLELHMIERQVLGKCPTKSDYLQKRLSCDAETIAFMVRKNHKLLSTNASKLKAHLDFVEARRLGCGELIQFPRFFNFAVDTIESRYKEMEDLDLNFSIRELALDNRSYRRFLEYWRNIRSL